MISRNKIIDFIYKNINNLEASWERELDLLNAWDDGFSELYRLVAEYETQRLVTEREGNILVAFIVLAYDCHSTFLEPHKDRFDNKVRIITRLAGPSALVTDVFNEAVYCTNAVCNNVITWYVNYQKDSRWTRILANKEFASQATALAMEASANSKASVDTGNMLRVAEERDISADKLWEVLRTEFLHLDTALSAEGKQKATDNIYGQNFMSHEGYLRARIKREEDQRKKEELLKKNKKQAEKAPEKTA